MNRFSLLALSLLLSFMGIGSVVLTGIDANGALGVDADLQRVCCAGPFPSYCVDKPL